MDTGLETFKARFRFNPKRTGHLGVEREAFIVNRRSIPVPASPAVLDELGQDGRFTYELSACQIEMRTSPHRRLADLRTELVALDEQVRAAAAKRGHLIDCTEVGQSGMTLAVYPDATGRYQRIAETMPRETLSAACRIIGTHVHIGLRDHESALKTYNRVINHLPHLTRLGDRSRGERMRLYRIVAPECDPPPYADWTAFYEDALRHGFVENPRDNWRLVRLTAHGTIEARMFGATPDIDEVVSWAREFSLRCAD